MDGYDVQETGELNFSMASSPSNSSSNNSSTGSSTGEAPMLEEPRNRRSSIFDRVRKKHRRRPKKKLQDVHEFQLEGQTLQVQSPTETKIANKTFKFMMGAFGLACFALLIATSLKVFWPSMSSSSTSSSSSQPAQPVSALAATSVHMPLQIDDDAFCNLSTAERDQIGVQMAQQIEAESGKKVNFQGWSGESCSASRRLLNARAHRHMRFTFADDDAASEFADRLKDSTYVSSVTQKFKDVTKTVQQSDSEIDVVVEKQEEGTVSVLPPLGEAAEQLRDEAARRTVDEESFVKRSSKLELVEQIEVLRALVLAQKKQIDVLTETPSEAGPRGETGPRGQRGERGETGATGSAASVTVGTVSTVSSEASATVTNVGSASAAQLNFKIPQGAPGQTAFELWLEQAGNQGKSREDFIAALKGEQGLQGAQGQAGKSAFQLWIDQGNSGDQEAFLDSLIGPIGPQGLKGADGSGVSIKGTVTNVQSLPSQDQQTGDMYIDAQTGNGHTWTGDQWLNVGPIRGPQGEQGVQGQAGQHGMSAFQLWRQQADNQDKTQDDFFAALQGAQGVQGVQGATGQSGAAASVSVGSVTTGAAGSQAKVTNSGTGAAASLDFEIPRGATGARGADGDSAYQVWLQQSNNQGKSIQEYLASLQGPRGLQGEKGDAGSGVTIKGTVASAAELPQQGQQVGDMHIDAQTGDGHTWTGQTWVNVGPVRGPRGLQGVQGQQGVQGNQGIKGDQGEQGVKGQAATVSIGSVTTGTAGSAASVTNSGTSENAQLDFVLPRGAQGPQGPQGIQGVQGETGPQGKNGTEGTCLGVLGGNRIFVGGRNRGWYQQYYTAAGVRYYNPHQEIHAKVGDVLVFSHPSSSHDDDVWLFPDPKEGSGMPSAEERWENCDFSNLTVINRLANSNSEIRFRGHATHEKPAFEFALAPQHEGTLYFASAGCTSSTIPNGNCPAGPPNFEATGTFLPTINIPENIINEVCKKQLNKIKVNVAPLQTVVVASNSDSDLAESSATVRKMQGIIQQMARLQILQQVQHEQRIRSEGGSGLTPQRGFGNGVDSFHDASYASSSTIMNIHDHADFIDTIGMGEIQAVLNGVEFQTRHNDYKLNQPSAEALNTYHKTQRVEFPPVPPAVLAKTTVAEQIEEMQLWFKAFNDQDFSVRDYRPYFKPVMTYLEGTWITANGDIEEPFASDRHSIEAKTWAEAHDKIRYLVNSGRKNNLENMPYLPHSIRSMDNESNPVFANWEYRVLVQPLKDDVPLRRFRVAKDLHVQVSGRPRTREEIFWRRNARFELNPYVDGSGNPRNDIEGDHWHNSVGWNYYDYLMEQIPGKDGPDGNLTDVFFDSYAIHYHNKDDKPLNAAYYSRFYDTKESDAMGRNRRRRGFNDGFLWAARTSHERVSRLEVEDPQKVDPTCDDDDCERVPYKRQQAWSWAIPLEIVWLTPLTEWNPYNITYLGYNYHKPATGCFGEPNPSKATGKTLVEGGGRTGKPTDGVCEEAKALNCNHHSKFYKTPIEFFGSEDGEVDPADTAGRLTCVKDSTGVVREVMASGHWIIFPSIGQVGRVRQRYPIAPIHAAGSTTWKEVKAFERIALGDNYDDMHDQDGFFGGQRDAKYGFTLTLMGGGHDHDFDLSGYRHKQWAPMVRSDGYTVQEYEFTTKTGNAHQHVVRVSRTQPAGNPDAPFVYKLEACKLKGATEWDEQDDPEHVSCDDGHISIARLS